MPKSRKYIYYEHQGKGKKLAIALQERDWTPTNNASEAVFILTDVEVAGRAKRMKTLSDAFGTKTFVYPHAARPDLLGNIAGYEPSPHTTAHFVTTPGHVEIMSAFGYPHPMPVMGWCLSDLMNFQPRRRVWQVLFAPIHASATGWLSSTDKTINVETFGVLHALVRAGKINLTVRYLYNLAFIGIPIRGDVQYIKGAPNQKTPEADVTDVVVSHQTFAHICIAKGIPTVMMGEDIAPRLTLTDGRWAAVKNWDSYKHLLKFPLDILDTRDPWKLLQDAIASDEAIRDWKSRLIGDTLFDPKCFVDTLEGYL